MYVGRVTANGFLTMGLFVISANLIHTSSDITSGGFCVNWVALGGQGGRVHWGGGEGEVEDARKVREEREVEGSGGGGGGRDTVLFSSVLLLLR